MTKTATKRRKLAQSMGSFDSLRDDLRGEMQHIRRHLDALEERLNNFTEL